MKAFGHWCWRNFSSTRHQLLRSVGSIFKFTNHHSLWTVLWLKWIFDISKLADTCHFGLVYWLARLHSPMSRASLGQDFAANYLRCIFFTYLVLNSFSRHLHISSLVFCCWRWFACTSWYLFIFYLPFLFVFQQAFLGGLVLLSELLPIPLPIRSLEVCENSLGILV